MSNILIAGGTGLLGSRLSQLLKEKGHQVFHLSRKQNLNAEFPAYQWDLNNKTIDEKAMVKADYIINLAGAGVADARWTAARKKLIIDSRVDSARLLKSYIYFYNRGLRKDRARPPGLPAGRPRAKGRGCRGNMPSRNRPTKLAIKYKLLVQTRLFVQSDCFGEHAQTNSPNEFVAAAAWIHRISNTQSSVISEVGVSAYKGLRPGTCSPVSQHWSPQPTAEPARVVRALQRKHISTGACERTRGGRVSPQRHGSLQRHGSEAWQYFECDRAQRRPLGPLLH